MSDAGAPPVAPRPARGLRALARTAWRRAPKPPTVPPDHRCPNCDTPAPSHYCPNCGQETRRALPTLREFSKEAMGRVISLDSRMWRTLFALAFRPGFLTNAYLAGRRRHYIRPARLFLILSLILFIVIRVEVGTPDFSKAVIFDDDKAAAGAPNDAAAGPPKDAMTRAPKDAAAPAPKDAQADVPKDAAAREKAIRDAVASQDPAKLRDELRDAIQAAVKDARDEEARAAAAKALAAAAEAGKGPAADAAKDAPDKSRRQGIHVGVDDNFDLDLGGAEKWPVFQEVKARLARFNTLSATEKSEQIYNGALRYGSYVVFLLLPAFAFLQYLLYLGRGKRYPSRPRYYAEHLVYAAHLHSYFFLAAIVLLVVPLVEVRWIVGAWTIWYMLRSRRVVYRGSGVGLVARSILLAVAYTFVLATAFALLLLVAVVMR